MSAAVLGGDEGAQLSGLQGFEIDDALGLRPFRQRGEVAAVGVERVRGHAALDFEVGEVVGDGGVHGAAALAVIPAKAGMTGRERKPQIGRASCREWVCQYV